MSEFDAQMVLHHLNSMGFRNISAEQLKYFTKDLKKIVKYDARLLNINLADACPTNAHFQAPTVSSCAKVQAKKSNEPNKENNIPAVTTTVKVPEHVNKMWIRPRLKSNKVKVTEDAVQLYHKYQKDWNRFKPNLPGENDHSELRWKIRTKMLGDGN